MNGRVERKHLGEDDEKSVPAFSKAAATWSHGEIIM